MRKLLLMAVFAFVATVCTSENASAQQPVGLGGFAPFGFYQPYGARFDTAIRTPPYFSTNPPVYYGARFRRPYGVSPFAAPPSVNAPLSYGAGVRPEPQRAPLSNPHIIANADVKPKADAINTGGITVAKTGDIQVNPFVDQTDYLVIQ